MAISTKVGYKEGLIVQQQQNARLLIFLLSLESSEQGKINDAPDATMNITIATIE
ncbi:MAG: hypothetical protein ACJ71E_03985 [Nitrososphaeraceae archaeon]